MWDYKFTQRATRQLSALDPVVARRIVKFLDQRIIPSADPCRTALPLTGYEGKIWRWRIGDYRVLFHLPPSSHTLVIVAIGHRRDIYSRLPADLIFLP